MKVLTDNTLTRLNYSQIYEQFQTNQVLQHDQDSPPNNPSSLAASDKKQLRPSVDKHEYRMYRDMVLTKY